MGSRLHSAQDVRTGYDDTRSLETAVGVVYEQETAFCAVLTITLVRCSSRAFFRSSCQ